MKRLTAVLLLALFSMGALSACNTMEGLGKDVQEARREGRGQGEQLTRHSVGLREEGRSDPAFAFVGLWQAAGAFSEPLNAGK